MLEYLGFWILASYYQLLINTQNRKENKSIQFGMTAKKNCNYQNLSDLEEENELTVLQKPVFSNFI